MVSAQSKQDATEQMEQKTTLEIEKKTKEDLATEKEKARDRKLKTIGNYVHPSVPVSDNEVRWLSSSQKTEQLTTVLGQ